jgi:DNA-binding transcriptional regulator YiaG
VLLRWVELTRTPDRDALDLLGLEVVKPVSARQLMAERKRLGLSQAGYAVLLGVHPSVVSAWEGGRKDPGRPGLEKLHAAWGISKAAAQRRLARGVPVRVVAARRKRSAPAHRFPKPEHRLSYHPEEALAAIEKRAAKLRELIKHEKQFSPEAVRRHRLSLGLSATRYGQLVGVHMQCIYGWEHGRFRPKPELLRRWVELTRTAKAPRQ